MKKTASRFVEWVRCQQLEAGMSLNTRIPSQVFVDGLVPGTATNEYISFCEQSLQKAELDRKYCSFSLNTFSDSFNDDKL